MAQVQRPFSVTLLEVFAVVSGLLNIAAGVFAIVDRENLELVFKTQLSPDQLLWAGILLILFGGIKVILGMALGRGSEAVRILFAVVAALNLAGGIWGAIALHGEQQASAVVSAVLAGLALWLLFNQRTQEFFEKMNK